MTMPNDAEFLHEVVDGTRSERLQRIVNRQMAELYGTVTIVPDTTSNHVWTTIHGPVVDTLSRYTATTWSYNANL